MNIFERCVIYVCVTAVMIESINLLSQAVLIFFAAHMQMPISAQ